MFVLRIYETKRTRQRYNLCRAGQLLRTRSKRRALKTKKKKNRYQRYVQLIRTIK